MADLDSIIEGEVSRLLFDSSYYKKLLKVKKAETTASVPAEVGIITKKIQNLDKQIGRLMDLYQDERMPMEVVSARIGKLHRDKVALEEQLAAIEPPGPKRDYSDDAFAALLDDFATVWKSADAADRREIISTLIDKIVLDDDHVKIEWAFL